MKLSTDDVMGEYATDRPEPAPIHAGPDLEIVTAEFVIHAREVASALIALDKLTAADLSTMPAETWKTWIDHAQAILAQSKPEQRKHVGFVAHTPDQRLQSLAGKLAWNVITFTTAETSNKMNYDLDLDMINTANQIIGTLNRINEIGVSNERANIHPTL